MNDDLGDHRVELDAHIAAGLDAGIEPRLGRRFPSAHAPAGGQKVVGWVFRVEARLDGMAAERKVFLAVAQRLSLGDAQLLAHQIQAGDFLRDGMLHLQAGVHFQEPELAAVHQELDGAGGGVADALRGGDGRSAHLRPQGRVHGRRGRFLNDLLMAALNGTLALEQMHQVPVQIAQDLEFDMARRREPTLQEHGVVAERGGRLAAGASHCIGQVGFCPHDAHAPAAAPGRRLHQHGIADFAGGRRQVAVGGEFHGRQGRHTRLPHQRFGGELVAHGAQRLDGGPHPTDASRRHGRRELGVLGKEAVAWVYRVRAAALGRFGDFGDVQVSFRGAAAVQGDGGVRLAHERRVGIAVRIDRDGGDAHVVGRANHAARDFAPIGDQEPPNGLDGYIRHVPNSLVPRTSPLWQTDKAMAMTARVSRGSIMPSSETREVA